MSATQVLTKWLPKATTLTHCPASDPTAWDEFWEEFYDEADRRRAFWKYDKAADRILQTLESRA